MRTIALLLALAPLPALAHGGPALQRALAPSSGISERTRALLEGAVGSNTGGRFVDTTPERSVRSGRGEFKGHRGTLIHRVGSTELSTEHRSAMYPTDPRAPRTTQRTRTQTTVTTAGPLLTIRTLSREQTASAEAGSNTGGLERRNRSVDVRTETIEAKVGGLIKFHETRKESRGTLAGERWEDAPETTSRVLLLGRELPRDVGRFVQGFLTR